MTVESKKTSVSSGTREFVFENVVSKEESVTYIVKISSDQNDYYRVSEITVNFMTGRIEKIHTYSDFEDIPNDSSDSSSDDSSSDSSDDSSGDSSDSSNQ